MKTIDETLTIIHLENNHRKINTLEEIEILKAVSPNTYSIVSSQDKMTQYTNFSPHQWFELKDQHSRPSNKQKFKIFKTNNYKINDLNSNRQLPKQGDRSNLYIHKACWKCCINNEMPTGKKHTSVRWEDAEK